MREEASGRFSGGGTAWLWFAVLAGPLGWFLHLTVSYSLVRYACLNGSAWLSHAVTLAAVVLPAAGAWAGYAAWRSSSRADQQDERGRWEEKARD